MKEFGSSPAPHKQKAETRRRPVSPPLSTGRWAFALQVRARQSQLPPRPEGGPVDCTQRPVPPTGPVKMCHCPPAVQYSTSNKKSLVSECGDGRVKLEHRPPKRFCTLSAVSPRTCTCPPQPHLSAAGPSKHSSHSFHIASVSAVNVMDLFSDYRPQQWNFIYLRPRPSIPNLYH